MNTLNGHPLPFLTTHVANIALNKQLGLIFLLQDAQNTHGFTSVSEESLVSDQIHVGSWMIGYFLPGNMSADLSINPWIEFEPFDQSIARSVLNVDRLGIKRHEQVAQEIEDERVALGDRVWDLSHEPSVVFLRKVIAQAAECVNYTTNRLYVVKQSALIASQEPQASIPFPQDLVSGMAYIAYKNAITPPMMFSRIFVETMRKIVAQKAVQEGYAKPAPC